LASREVYLRLVGCFCFGESASVLIATDRLELSAIYLAELKCPHSYYDDDHYCAIEFRCYVDDSASPKGFSYTLYDDC